MATMQGLEANSLARLREAAINTETIDQAARLDHILDDLATRALDWSKMVLESVTVDALDSPAELAQSD